MRGTSRPRPCRRTVMQPKPEYAGGDDAAMERVRSFFAEAMHSAFQEAVTYMTVT